MKLKQTDRALAALRRYLKLPFPSEHGRQEAQWRLGELTKKPAAA